MINTKNLIKYVIMFVTVAASTFYIPNCSIINKHAAYIGLLASTVFVLLDRYLPHVVIVKEE